MLFSQLPVAEKKLVLTDRMNVECSALKRDPLTYTEYVKVLQRLHENYTVEAIAHITNKEVEWIEKCLKHSPDELREIESNERNEQIKHRRGLTINIRNMLADMLDYSCHECQHVASTIAGQNYCKVCLKPLGRTP